MTPQAYGLMFACGLILFGLVTGLIQIRGLRNLRQRKLVPSDERAYFSRRYRRRLLTGVLLATIGVLIGGAYLSGMERRADGLSEGQKSDATPTAEGEKPEIPEADKQFVRFWGAYWIVVLILVFAVLFLAFTDAWATRRYWLVLYRHLREDHQAKLRRDLAVLRQHKEQSRAGRFGLPPANPSEDN